MKYKFYKRVTCALVSASMLLSLGACGTQRVSIEPMEIEDVHAVSFDFLGGADVMPISGFYGPYAVEYSEDGQSFPDYLTDEIFELVTECGLNLTHYTRTDYKLAPEQIIKTLELGGKHKLGIFVQDQSLKTMASDDKESLLKVSERLTEYSDYPAFCGVYVVDEPGTPY